MNISVKNVIHFNPFSCKLLLGCQKNYFYCFSYFFCVVRTPKIVWFRKKVSDSNFIICCNYATSPEKGSKNDKKLKLLVVYP